MSFSAPDAKKQTEINEPIRVKRETLIKKEIDLLGFTQCIKTIKNDSSNGHSESCCKNISNIYENKLLNLGYKLVRAGVKHHDCLYVTW
jgi:hypothetical protein